MSLVGNLEDLSLGDLMQIISLSLKSGLLVLKDDQRSGQIVFYEGLVFGACLIDVDAGEDDRSGLLERQGILDPAGFDMYAARAAVLSVQGTLSGGEELDVESINALLQESVESAVIEMFSWSSGNFTFDASRETESDALQLMLETGINSQYLAMEAMRSLDERGQADELFADESVDSLEALDGDSAADRSSDLESVAPKTAADGHVESVLENDAGIPVDEGVAAKVASPRSTAKSGSGRAASPAVRRAPPPSGTLILMDPDVVVLEWIKKALSVSFKRVHVFQRTEQGLARIRQYLIRGELPVVLISLEAKVDPLSGIRGLADFVGRLKAQAAQLLVLGLVAEDQKFRPALSSSFDELLVRPARSNLLDAAESADDPSAKALSEMLAGLLVDRSPDSPGGG